MGEATAIEWCHATFNPWIGCSKVSAGCANCYAETLMDHRYKKVNWGEGGTRIRTSPSYWKQPLKWDREAAAAGERRRVFCASLADVFESPLNQNLALVLDTWRVDLWALITATPNLDWLLLTKRPRNVKRFVPDSWMRQWPRNVWIGTSIEDQEAANQRVPYLLTIPAAVRFLSVEPLLGPVDLNRIPVPQWVQDMDPTWHHAVLDADRVSWVIVGGESGPGARSMDLAWARSIRDQCAEAGVAFFFKQVGGERNKGGHLDVIPEDLRIREYPQEAMKK